MYLKFSKGQEIGSETAILAFLFDLCPFNLLTKACFKLQCSSHWWKPRSPVLLSVPVTELCLNHWYSVLGGRELGIQVLTTTSLTLLAVKVLFGIINWLSFM